MIVYGVAFDVAGRFVASAQDDGRISLWNAHTGLRSFELRGHQEAVRGVSFGPSGGWLASCSVDGSIALWNIDTGEHRLGFGHHDGGGALSVAFSPDGGSIASSCEDGTVSIWDVQRRTRTAAFRHDASVLGVAWALDGQQLVTGSFDRTARVWGRDGEERLKIKSDCGPVFGIACGPGGVIAMACSRAGQLVGDQRLLPSSVWVADDGPCHAITFHPDGSVAMGSGPVIMLVEQPTERTLRGHSGLVNSLAYSADGHVLASGSDDGTVRLWDLRSPAAAPRVLVPAT